MVKTKMNTILDLFDYCCAIILLLYSFDILAIIFPT